MKIKIPFAEYRMIHKMSHNEFDRWLQSFYKAAFNDGYDVCKNEVTDEMDLGLVSIAIQSTEGVGTVLHKRIMETINNLCFNKVGAANVDDGK